MSAITETEKEIDRKTKSFVLVLKTGQQKLTFDNFSYIAELYDSICMFKVVLIVFVHVCASMNSTCI